MPTGVYKRKPHSEATKRKIGEANKGRKFPGRGGRKKGCIPWNKGIKTGIVTNGAWKKGHISHNKGKHLSETTRKKMSKAHTGMVKPWARGSRNANWNGGITPLTKQIRKCKKYIQWREAVFTRDNYTCVLCNKRGGYLEADHYPKGFAEIFHQNNIKSLQEALDCKELWDINNGRTVHGKCHDKPGRKYL